MTGRSNKNTRKSLLFMAFIFLFALLSISVLVVLKHGVAIDRIDLSSFKAERIRIQVDGGIIFTIDRLDILDRQTTDPRSNPEFFISRFNTLAFLFREIRIDKIHYQEHVYHLKFTDNLFTVSSDSFQLVSTITYAAGEIQLTISKLEIKPSPWTLSGTATYEKETGKLGFSGRFMGPEVSGQLKISKLQDQLEAKVNTSQFADLAGILATFPLDTELVAWIEKNVTADEYRIEQLTLSTALRDGKPIIQPDSISGRAIATNAAITFDSSLPPVQSKEIHISLENDRLYFELDDPVYKTKSLAGSSVAISPLLIGDTQLDINIQTDTQLDSEIHTLLEIYNIHLPFSQQSGTTRADLHLIFDLPGFTLHTNGSFATDAGNWNWGDISFQTSGTVMQLQDNLIKIEKAEIAYQDMIEASLTGSIDLEEQQATLTADIAHLDFRAGEKDIVKADNLTTPINIQFSGEEVNIHLVELETAITLNPTQKLIAIDNLNKVKPYIIPLQNFHLQDGMVSVDIHDPAQLTFEGIIYTSILPLSLNDKPVTRYAFQGRKSGSELIVSINDGKISLELTDRLNVEIQDYLVTLDTTGTGEGDMDKPISPIPVFISGPACSIKTPKIIIPARNFQAELSGKNIAFTADLDQGKVLFESDGKDMTINASEIDARIVQDFFDFADLQKGRFNISFQGKGEKNYEGHLEFSNVLIKDLVSLNNIVAFLNTVPALATLSSPGFDRDGYHIDEGILHFTISNRLMTIHQLQTEGKTIDLEAEGWINFENDTLKFNIEVISLKDYSKIIEKIPLAGYAILGEDGSMSTSLDITGSREHPEIKTRLAKDIGMIPIKILKRTLKWPFRTLKKMSEFGQQVEEEEQLSSGQGESLAD